MRYDPSTPDHEDDAPHGIVVARLVARAGNSASTLVLTFTTDRQRFSVIVRARHAWRPVSSGPAFDTAPMGAIYILVIGRTAGNVPILEHAIGWRAAVAQTRTAVELASASALPMSVE